MYKGRKPGEVKPITQAQWDEAQAKYPPGRYAMYWKGREEVVNLRGYSETPCGDVGLILCYADDPCAVFGFCPVCMPNHKPPGRLELVARLE